MDSTGLSKRIKWQIGFSLNGNYTFVCPPTAPCNHSAVSSAASYRSNYIGKKCARALMYDSHVSEEHSVADARSYSA